MTREEKGAVIEELKQKFAEHPYFYVMDSGGMTVAQINDFRRTCFEKGIEYKVYKNTLIKKALESLDADYVPFDEKVLTGFSGILFSVDSGSEPAKMLKQYWEKGNEKPVFKGASIDQSLYIGEDNIEALTKVKSKKDMIAELVGLLMSPGQQLASALNAPGQQLASALNNSGGKLAGVLKALAEKEEK